MIDIPLDLPGQPFSEQLATVAKWAHLDPALLLDNQAKIAASFKNRPEALKALLECCPSTPWEWPVYAAYIAVKLAEDEPDDLDDVREFHRDERHDMVEHVYDKLRSNFYALYEKNQIDSLIEFNPYWQIKGDCSDPFNRDVIRTRHAGDAAWAGECVPWRCERLYCRCQVHALSPRELARYAEEKGRDDPAVGELLKELAEYEKNNPSRVICTVTLIED
jgi:hypothetical protein